MQSPESELTALARRHEREILQAVAEKLHVPDQELTLLKEDSFAVEGQSGAYGFLVMHSSGMYGVHATLVNGILQDFKVAQL